MAKEFFCREYLWDKVILLAAVLLIFGGYFFLGLGSIHPDVQGDFKIYLGLAQAMDSGQVLYQGASDTKNMGFFAFFYGFYKLYSLFNGDLSHIYLWAHITLTLIYFFSALIIYHVVDNLSQNKLKSLAAALCALLYFSLLEHAYILNQPQAALLWALGIMLFLSKERSYTKGEFFLLGLLLGGAFACASPYITLTLIVPFLSLRKKPKVSSFLMDSFIALGGFLLALLPFFIYFLWKGALSGWFYYNVQFLTVKANFGTKFPLPFTKAVVGIFFTLSNYPQTILVCLTALGSSCLWLLKSGQAKLFPPPLQASMVLGFLSLLSRLILELHHSSYNFYFIPFLIIIPAILIQFVRQKIFWLGLGLWAFFALKAPASYLQGYPDVSYDPQTAAILKANEDKNPLYTLTPGTYSYTCNGKSTPYSAFLSPLRYVAKYSPEIVFGAPTSSDYLQNITQNPRPYEQKLQQQYPLPAEAYFTENYTQVSPVLFIRKDAVEQWRLNVSPFPATEFWMRERLKLPDNWKQILNKYSKNKAP